MGARLEDYGLSESIVDDIHARERRQFELFLRLTGAAAAVVWVVLTVLVYTHSRGRASSLALVAAPLLALLGAVVAALPLSILCGLGVLLLYPRHPLAGALERYEAETTPARECDVCVLVRGDRRPREGVAYCGRCQAWLCPDCRRRYDLRAIAALRARTRPTPR